jgi:hypothetical protein
VSDREIEADIEIYPQSAPGTGPQAENELKVELQGFDLPDEEKVAVEAEIMRLVEAEVAEYQHTRPEEESEAAEHQQSRAPVTEPADYRSSQPGEIDVSLTALQMPNEELERIESRIRRSVAKAIPMGSRLAAEAAAAEVSVVSAALPAMYYLDDFYDPRMLPTSERPEIRVHLYFPEDLIRLDIRRGFEETPPLTRNETTVAHSRQVGWDKHIRTTESPNRGIWAIKNTDYAPFSCLRYPNSARMTVPSNLRPTLIYEKPKEWGRWTPMYRWYSPQFMHIFGGYRLGHCWWRDSDTRPWPSEGGFFRTSFEINPPASMPEPADPLPTWSNTPERLANVRAWQPYPNPRCLATMPVAEFPTPPHFGYRALLYEGYATGGTSTHCYFSVFDVNRPVTAGSKMTYFLYAQQDLGLFVGVDLICTDGTSLCNSGAVDEGARLMHPKAAHSGMFEPGEWNMIRCNIGVWLAGKTIDRIVVGFERDGSTGLFRGYIDDIYIS